MKNFVVKVTLLDPDPFYSKYLCLTSSFVIRTKGHKLCFYDSDTHQSKFTLKYFVTFVQIGNYGTFLKVSKKDLGLTMLPCAVYD